MKLKFIGFQEDGNGGRFPLWNLFNSPKPELHPDGSTVSLQSWKALYTSIQCTNTLSLND